MGIPLPFKAPVKLVFSKISFILLSTEINPPEIFAKVIIYCRFSFL